MVADKTNGMNNQISAKGYATNDQGALWCWMSKPRTGMCGAAGGQDSDTSWLGDKHGTQNECITGVSDIGIGGVSTAAARLVQWVQRLCNMDPVGLGVGEVRYIQCSGVVQQETG